MKIFYQICAVIVILASFTACSKPKGKTLKIAALSTPHAEILEQLKDDLADKGILLEVVVVEDYNTPNRALSDREVDANFFQHIPFLELQKEEFGYKLVNLVPVHIEPMGIYSQKIGSLSELKERAIVAIPNDPSNQARALFLLETQRLIVLKNRTSKASLLDISSNPLELQFVEIDASLLPRVLPDVDLAAINTNYALQAELDPRRDSLAIESGDSPYANIVVIREEDSGRADLEQLRNVITSEKVRHFIETHYAGSIRLSLLF